MDEQGTYNRLINLYRMGKESKKTPLEDFTTEILVGILESRKEILDKFVNNVLKIDGEGFYIDSQVRYSGKNTIEGKNRIIDIVIKNEDTICFVENKVNSLEGIRQLEDYKNILIDPDAEWVEKTQHLRYCSKYFEKKEVKDIDFQQIRWSDVYDFFLEQSDDDRIIDFIKYMESENMKKPENFNAQDLITMNNINYTIKKMDECFAQVEDSLRKVIGKKIDIKSNPANKIIHILRFSRYAIWCENIFGDGYSQVLLSFQFSETSVPSMQVLVYCDNKNSKINEFKKHTKFFHDRITHNTGHGGWFYKPLSDFLSSDDQIDKIVEWYKERLNDIKRFIENTPDLNWKI